MWQFSSGYSAVLLRLIPSRHLPPTQYCERRSGQATDTIRRASPFAPLPVSANVGSHLRHERPDHTLQPTALVHEAYIKLVGLQNAAWQSRVHFFAVASNVMRQILVDYARRQHRAKRGGRQEKVSLDEVLLVTPDRPDKILALHECLTRLEELDGRQARIVELRYFGGLTVEEAAEVLGVSLTTIRREWTTAKAWLYGELKEQYGNHA